MNSKVEVSMNNGRNFTNWIDAFLDYTENTEVTPAFSKWTALSTIAAVLRKKVHFNFGRIRVYPNLYVVLVAEPGVARKTQAISYASDILESLDNIILGSDSITRESLFQEIEEAETESLLPNGETLVHNSLTVISGEFESFLGQKKDNTKILVQLTDLFDCKAKPWRYRTKTAGRSTLSSVYLNILAATTPDSIASCFPTIAIGGGLTTRMLFVWPDAGKRKKVAIPELTQEVIDSRLKLIQDLEKIAMIAGEYNFDPAAKEFWINWYNDFEELDPKRLCKDPSFNGWYTRKPLFILKVSTLLAASESDNRIVSVKHVKRAIKEIELVESRMTDTFVSVGRSEISSDVATVIKIVNETRVISEKLLKMRVWKDIDYKKFDNVISTAISSGYIERKLEHNGKRGLFYCTTETEISVD